MGELSDVRRREANRIFIKYFVLAFVVVCVLSVFVAYAVIDSRAQRADSLAIRMEYCRELEKLKAQNRDEIAEKKKNYARNLRLLGISDTKEIRDAAEEGWQRELDRNAARRCPYTADN